jgi:hypothetical protein
MKKNAIIRPRNLVALELFTNGNFKPKATKVKKKYSRKRKHKNIDSDE